MAQSSSARPQWFRYLLLSFLVALGIFLGYFSCQRSSRKTEVSENMGAILNNLIRGIDVQGELERLCAPTPSHHPHYLPKLNVTSSEPLMEQLRKAVAADYQKRLAYRGEGAPESGLYRKIERYSFFVIPPQKKELFVQMVAHKLTHQKVAVRSITTQAREIYKVCFFPNFSKEEREQLGISRNAPLGVELVLESRKNKENQPDLHMIRTSKIRSFQMIIDTREKKIRTFFPGGEGKWLPSHVLEQGLRRLFLPFEKDRKKHLQLPQAKTS